MPVIRLKGSPQHRFPVEQLDLLPAVQADRFRHDGDQYIPGAGRRWSHVHRTKDAQPNEKVSRAWGLGIGFGSPWYPCDPWRFASLLVYLCLPVGI